MKDFKAFLMNEKMDKTSQIADNFTRFLIGDRKNALSKLKNIKDFQIEYENYNKTYSGMSKDFLDLITDKLYDLNKKHAMLISDNFVRYLMGDRNKALSELKKLMDLNIDISIKPKDYNPLFQRLYKGFNGIIEDSYQYDSDY